MHELIIKKGAMVSCTVCGTRVMVTGHREIAGLLFYCFCDPDIDEVVGFSYGDDSTFKCPPCLGWELE